ncbi:adenylate kinase [Nocardia huaxiensis]|uniref:Adenylate kinase n=1 Tax=Nocardia huaxiensis TaxID=2755382 RepID=A0A7D6VAN3_9NOCA|nr:adenylate kinase [Nocardia huaxiensis]QLY31841.1 adenylate kinase [Nocardia huaxiensis]UFS95406.1 adenylate kinase [Nocardia huaxiensis]
MRLVFLGPPGAGKGTQAEQVAEKLGVPHISTGNLFRTNISEQTPLGREAQQYLDAGNLVPSDVTNRMVEARIAEPDAVNGFVLDGYPRTIDQAEALEKMLKESGHELDSVISLEVAEEILVERMLARKRADDTEEVIRNRMRVYREETEPLLSYYDGHITAIDGVGEIDEVNARILKALGR